MTALSPHPIIAYISIPSITALLPALLYYYYLITFTAAKPPKEGYKRWPGTRGGPPLHRAPLSVYNYGPDNLVYGSGVTGTNDGKEQQNTYGHSTKHHIGQNDGGLCLRAEACTDLKFDKSLQGQHLAKANEREGHPEEQGDTEEHVIACCAAGEGQL